MSWSSPSAQGIGWIVLYAAIYWGSYVLVALFEERLPAGPLNDAAQLARLLIPLLAAFLIGMRLHAWWWVAGPPLAIILLQLAYPAFTYLTASAAERPQMGTGLILVSAGVFVVALLATLLAAAGVWLGKR